MKKRIKVITKAELKFDIDYEGEFCCEVCCGLVKKHNCCSLFNCNLDKLYKDENMQEYHYFRCLKCIEATNE